ncbi:MAG: hypothetical protein NXI30_15730 [bacterium]|nr:hypothetical protein [bacterium]
MAATEKLTVFATGNGDSILIESHGLTVLTDFNHKLDPDGEFPDIDEELRDACPHARLDVFVLTHPDVDHIRGFAEVFHAGTPGQHSPRSRILVDEIWCSPYAVSPNYVTDEAKPLLDEVRRRYALVNTPEGQISGNRLRVLAVGEGDESGHLCSGLSWELLGPTLEEADIPRASPGESENSSNGSSLIIRWTIDVDGKANKILLAGDATANVLERVYRDNRHKLGRLAWNILVSPHHSSRHAMGWKDADDQFHFLPDSVNALSQTLGTGWVVSSSKPVRADGDDPPSPIAKKKYIEILGGAGDRFLCTGSHGADGKPGNVVFRFGSSGPARSKRGSRSGSAASTAVTGGGNYG